MFPASSDDFPCDLKELLVQDADVGSYFLSLPDDVRLKINEHAYEIHSEKELKQFADNCISLSLVASAFLTKRGDNDDNG